MTDPELHNALPALERLAVAAWVAHQHRAVGGWLWRFSNGGSKRANSVATLGAPEPDAERALDLVEELYARAGAPSQVYVADVSVPADLAGRLIRRGYALIEETTTMALRFGRAAGDHPPGFTSAAAPDRGWLETYESVLTPSRKEQARRILARSPAGSRFCSIVRDGATLATALVVADGGAAIVECVAVSAAARRGGMGRALMTGVHAEAQALGAGIAGLQVMSDNAPAIGLYAGLGYVNIGRNDFYAKPIPPRTP